MAQLEEAFQLRTWQLTFEMASQIDDIAAFEAFSPPLTNSTIEDFSDGSSIPFFSNNYGNNAGLTGSPAGEDGGQSEGTSFPEVDDFWEDLDGIEMVMSLINESEGNSESTITHQEDGTWSPSSSSPSTRTTAASLPENKLHAEWPPVVLPGGDMAAERSRTSGLFHLLKAYGEAVERGQGELSDVIAKCVMQMINPVGKALERVAFHLCPNGEKQGDKDYIRKESCKNLEEASRVFYQVFPYGKLAHFSANSTILEQVPEEVESIRLVDYELGEGIQWPPLIEALADQHREVKLTSLKWENGRNESIFGSGFEDTKRRLIDHARSVGLELKVEEMGIDELVSEIKRGRKRGGRREFLAFNCMVGLPHMRKSTSRKLVEEFLRVSNELLAYNGSRGVIVMGDGDALDTSKFISGFGSFFEANLVRYEALLNSIESSFPSRLPEARMALETIFVAPSISSLGCVQKWMELREGGEFQMGIGLEGCKVSRFGMEEAREMVRSLHSCYGVRIGGEQGNEMVLEWKGVPLVKVSSWRR